MSLRISSHLHFTSESSDFLISSHFHFTSESLDLFYLHFTSEPLDFFSHALYMWVFGFILTCIIQASLQISSHIYFISEYSDFFSLVFYEWVFDFFSPASYKLVFRFILTCILSLSLRIPSHLHFLGFLLTNVLQMSLLIFLTYVLQVNLWIYSNSSLDSSKKYLIYFQTLHTYGGLLYFWKIFKEIGYFFLEVDPVRKELKSQ